MNSQRENPPSFPGGFAWCGKTASSPEPLDSLDKEALIRLVLAQAETIATLTRRVEVLEARLERTSMRHC